MARKAITAMPARKVFGVVTFPHTNASSALRSHDLWIRPVRNFPDGPDLL
ncbi:hypothetical protein PBR20603_04007 [Pandoraea bronchicola]|uniref:Uncharacterized protein n=1 Tax=Pandoraea bronchicola TaxID=2508287 RepID=A0A5E5BW35_9BURK|nr:hypothetical protein PBR20603_04007 [Pandoraea bronchicola]